MNKKGLKKFLVPLLKHSNIKYEFEEWREDDEFDVINIIIPYPQPKLNIIKNN